MENLRRRANMRLSPKPPDNPASAMRRIAIWVAVLCLLGAPSAEADSKAEAGEAARNANCTPTKTEVIRYRAGEEGETVYKVACAEDKAMFLQVVCRSRNCTVLRPPNEFSLH